MSEQRRLIFSIVQFLNRELSSNDNSHSEDAKESLEVGPQVVHSFLSIGFSSAHSIIIVLFAVGISRRDIWSPQTCSTTTLQILMAGVETEVRSWFLRFYRATESPNIRMGIGLLQVASQCLQTAFCLSQEDTHLGVSKTLEEIFSDATQGEPLRKAGTPSEEDRNEADKMKGEGNELMRSENFEKAIEMYSKWVPCARACAAVSFDREQFVMQSCTVKCISIFLEKQSSINQGEMRLRTTLITYTITFTFIFPRYSNSLVKNCTIFLTISWVHSLCCWSRPNPHKCLASAETHQLPGCILFYHAKLVGCRRQYSHLEKIISWHLRGK